MVTEVRLVLTGGIRVGKTSFLYQWCCGVFTETEFSLFDNSLCDYRRTENVDGVETMISIADINVVEEQFDYVRLKVKNGQSFIFMFDVTSRKTFDEIKEHYLSIQQIRGAPSESGSIPAVLVGSKCDMVDKRVVSAEEGKALAEELGCPYFDVSAKEKLNLHESIIMASRQIKTETNERGCILS